MWFQKDQTFGLSFFLYSLACANSALPVLRTKVNFTSTKNLRHHPNPPYTPRVLHQLLSAYQWIPQNRDVHPKDLFFLIAFDDLLILLILMILMTFENVDIFQCMIKKEVFENSIGHFISTLVTKKKHTSFYD